MDKEQLKEKYRRFRQWQEQPFEYKLASDKVHHCNNCNHDFTGNFCPVCSQRAGTGRIGWNSVRQGVMDIWGLGTRSLLYSIWQLLLRPGHIIGDYIDGKRQVSFPPVKMLFIVTLIYSLVYFWLFLNVLDNSIAIAYFNEEQLKLMGEISNWIESYYSWYSLIMAVLAVLPTWVMFRYSPNHTVHSLPEGFFIQIFLAVLIIVLSIICIPLGVINQTLYIVISWCLCAMYYIIVYNYLFRYGVWGTLWRCGFVMLTVLLLMAAGFALASKTVFINDVKAKLCTVALILITALVVLLVGHVINLIATGKFRRKFKQVKAKAFSLIRGPRGR